MNDIQTIARELAEVLQRTPDGNMWERAIQGDNYPREEIDEHWQEAEDVLAKWRKTDAWMDHKWQAANSAMEYAVVLARDVERACTQAGIADADRALLLEDVERVVHRIMFARAFDASNVAAPAERIREANDTPTSTFDAWRDNLPAMSEHMTTPERTAEVVQWLVAVCGWDGVADAMANRAGELREGSPELLLKCGGPDALRSVLRLANHLAEATT